MFAAAVVSSIDGSTLAASEVVVLVENIVMEHECDDSFIHSLHSSVSSNRKCERRLLKEGRGRRFRGDVKATRASIDSYLLFATKNILEMG